MNVAGLIGKATTAKDGLATTNVMISTSRFSCTNGKAERLCSFTSSYQSILIQGTENVNGASFSVAVATSSTNNPFKIGTLPNGVHIYKKGSTVWIKADSSRHIEFMIPLIGAQTFHIDREAIPSDAVEL